MPIAPPYFSMGQKPAAHGEPDRDLEAVREQAAEGSPTPGKFVSLGTAHTGVR